MVQAINGVGPGISLVLRLTVHGMYLAKWPMKRLLKRDKCA